MLNQMQYNFTGNLDQAGNTTFFFIIEELKETLLDFLQETVNFNRISLYNYSI